jgi:hypothetical protein
VFRTVLAVWYTGARRMVEKKAVDDRALERVVGHLRNALNIVGGGWEVMRRACSGSAAISVYLRRRNEWLKSGI